MPESRVKKSDRRSCLRADLKSTFRKVTGWSSTKRTERTFFLVHLVQSPNSFLFHALHRTDPDFIDQTLLLLSDIAAARRKLVPPVVCGRRNKAQTPMPLDYPFNLILTSATIPAALATHLEAHHPKMTRLVSPTATPSFHAPRARILPSQFWQQKRKGPQEN
jgi:hypothetical protein